MYNTMQHIAQQTSKVLRKSDKLPVSTRKDPEWKCGESPEEVWYWNSKNIRNRHPIKVSCCHNGTSTFKVLPNIFVVYWVVRKLFILKSPNKALHIQDWNNASNFPSWGRRIFDACSVWTGSSFRATDDVTTSLEVTFCFTNVPVRYERRCLQNHRYQI